MWRHREKALAMNQEGALTGPHWHLDLGLTASRFVSNTFPLFIRQSVGFGYSSPNGLRCISSVSKLKCFQMFIDALFVAAQSWKQSRYPSTSKWIDKLWHIHAMVCDSAMKSSELLIHGTSQMNLKARTVSPERSQAKRTHNIWFCCYKILEINN